MRTLTSGILACLGILACGEAASGTAPADRAATTADVAAVCDAVCERSERCSTGDEADEPEAECEATCRSGFGGSELVQQRVAHAFRDCYRELPCNESDDVCSGRVAADLELDTASPLVNECIQVQDECGGFSDDFCTYAATATTRGKALLEECFSSPCDAVSECIEALRE